MKQLSADLTTILRQEMSATGAMSFHRFMELALYCPNIGYYERATTAVGSKGDFATSVSSGGLFGRMLARQFTSWCAEISGPITWVEAGAHDGRLACDLLSAAAESAPMLYERLQYLIVEPSENRRNWQHKTLKPFQGRVSWISGFHEAGSQIRGVIFSNELLDAFPVHRLRWNAVSQTWDEWGVSPKDDRFDWCILRTSDHDWSVDLSAAGISISSELAQALPNGFTLEISPAAGRWWTEAAGSLNSGWLMTIDYGLLAHELLAPERLHGTLRAYHRHSISDRLLEMPGEQDITAHANFSQLIRAGENAGLKTIELSSQASFFTPLAARFWTDAHPPTASEIRQFRTLAHPEHFGRAFRVLVQSTPAL